jgi:hypothetical protein
MQFLIFFSLIFIQVLNSSHCFAKHRKPASISNKSLGSDFKDHFEFFDPELQDACQFFGIIDYSKRIESLPILKPSSGYRLVKSESFQTGFYNGKYYSSRVTTQVHYRSDLDGRIYYKVDSHVRCKDYVQIPKISNSYSFQIPLLFSQTDRILSLLTMIGNLKGPQSEEIEFTDYEVSSAQSSFELFVQNLPQDETRTEIYNLGQDYYEVRSFDYDQNVENPKNRSETQYRMIYLRTEERRD